jgi:hypothetical protein
MNYLTLLRRKTGITLDTVDERRMSLDSSVIEKMSVRWADALKAVGCVTIEHR